MNRFSQRLFESNIAMKLRERINEAAPEPGDVDKDGHLYTPLTDDDKKRDLNPLTQSRMQEIAYWLYDKTALGHRLMEMQKDFVIGEGVKYVARDKNVQEVLDKFWKDPINNWPITQYVKALELGLFGEQFYPVWVNPVDGAVKLGYIDPANIKEVTRNKLNPMQLMTVVTKENLSPVVEIDEEPKNTYTIIGYDRKVSSETFEKLVGEIFYFSVNRLSNSTRGRSDLLSIADWIDMHEKFLFNVAERAYLQSSFIWDVEFEGKSQTWIDAWVKKHGLKVPKPGSIRYHNEKTKWSAVSPKLEAADMSEHARTLKNHILSGFGVPEHWVGEGANVTRATALEMGGPAYKRFKSRQFYYKYMIQTIFDYVIDQAIIHKTLKPNVDRKFVINMQPLSEKDVKETSMALVQISTSLQTAQDNDWITDNQAKMIFAHIVTQLGLELDTSETESVKEEKDYNSKTRAELIEELKSGNHRK